MSQFVRTISKTLRSNGSLGNRWKDSCCYMYVIQSYVNITLTNHSNTFLAPSFWYLRNLNISLQWVTLYSQSTREILELIGKVPTLDTWSISYRRKINETEACSCSRELCFYSRLSTFYDNTYICILKTLINVKEACKKC